MIDEVDYNKCVVLLHNFSGVCISILLSLVVIGSLLRAITAISFPFPPAPAIPVAYPSKFEKSVKYYQMHTER